LSGSERTADERERARAERARRRAARSGDAVPDDDGEAQPTPQPAAGDEQLPPEQEAPADAPVTAAPPPEPAIEPAAAEPPPPPSAPPPPAAPSDDGGSTDGGSRGRPFLARGAALFALLAVIAAVILLIRHIEKPAAKAPKGPTIEHVTVPEGKTRMQTALLARAHRLKGSYLRASVRSPLLDPATYGAPATTPNLEGFLFPATYDLYAGSTSTRLVEEQLEAFKENFSAEYARRAADLHETPYELLIVASLIEREAAAPSDRAKIADVIYNRLHEGIPIGIDASIYYAIELEKHVPTYTDELTEEQLHIDSPYNTRTHKGLPPTPISNPGLEAIHAAAYPARAGYLYYVLAPNGCHNDFFYTQAEFEAGVARYQAAEQAHGGHTPSCPGR